MAHARTKVSKRKSVSLHLSLNALVGILLAIIGTFIVFFGDTMAGSINVLVKIVAIFLICIGALSIVNYIRYRESTESLLLGIIELALGIVLICIPQITKYLLLIIGIALIVYGLFYCIRYRHYGWDIFTAVIIVVVGILVLLLYFINVEIFTMIVGIAALVGAAYFLFFA